MDRMNRGMPVRKLSDEVITKFQSIGPARIVTVTINSQIVPTRKYNVSDRVSDFSTFSLPHDSISDSEFHHTHTPHILISIFIMLSIFFLSHASSQLVFLRGDYYFAVKGTSTLQRPGSVQLLVGNYSKKVHQHTQLLYGKKILRNLMRTKYKKKPRISSEESTKIR